MTHRRLLAAVGLTALIANAGASAFAGTFSDIIPWDEIPIHAALLPNGKIMTFGATPQDGQGGYDYTLWDPSLGTASNAFLQIPNGINFDSFCVGGILYSGDASIFLAGGRSNQAAAKYLYQNSTMASLSSFHYSRYYASLTTLPDGRVLVNGGSPPYGGQANASPIPEVYNPGQGWVALTGAANSPMRQADGAATGNPHNYPQQYPVGNNELFIVAGKYTYRLNYSGNGSVRDEKPFTGSNYGVSSSGLMYRPGKIMHVGGGTYSNSSTDGHPGSKVATLFDLNTYPETRTETTMALGRHMLTTTVMANGEVLVTGGASVLETVSAAAYQSEIFNPTTGQWRLDATMQTPRLYHGIALLMKDGRVMVGGGGAPGPINGHSIEIYTPDYLLDGNHVPAVRPSIVAAPGRIALGQTFALSTDKPISRMTLVKTGVVTHNYNTDQRFFELTFTGGANNSYNVTFPNDAVNATPGLYMVFAFDKNGVPSVGKFVRLPSPTNDDGGSVPNDLPTPTTPTGSGVNAGGWLDCAQEWGTCNVPGNVSVRYGANAAYVTKTASGAVACTNAAFGNDPAYGLLKSCQYKVANTAPYGGNGTAVWGQPTTGIGESGGTNNAADTPVGTAEQQAALPMGVAAPLMTKNANLCVQIQGDSTANGAFLIAATCNNSAGQMWKLMPQGVGYKIVNTLTNKCIDVNAWSTDDGGVVQAWDCSGGTNQTWMPTQTAFGMSLVAQHSGKCLDLSASSTAVGTRVFQWKCYGGISQAFHKSTSN